MNKYLKSIGSVFWIFDNCYKKDIDKILNKTVAQAMREDWENVNEDFKNTFKKYKQSRRNVQ